MSESVRSMVVVEDVPNPCTVRDECAAASTGQIHGKGLVGLNLAIPIHNDRDCFARRAWGKGESAGRGQVVVVGGGCGAVGRGIADGHGLVVSGGELDCEDEQRRPAAPFTPGYIIDGDSRFVID